MKCSRVAVSTPTGCRANWSGEDISAPVQSRVDWSGEDVVAPFGCRTDRNMEDIIISLRVASGKDFTLTDPKILTIIALYS